MDARSEYNTMPISSYPAAVSRISVEELSAIDRAAWMSLRARNPALYSPYFHIEYTDHIAALRDDVSVIVVRGDDGVATGFLPIQGVRFARPVGAPMTDYHGFICAPDTLVDTASVLREAGVGAFYFDHLITSEPLDMLAPAKQSAAMDVSMGGEAWRAQKDGSYSRHIKDCRRRLRRAQEDIGPVSSMFKSRDRAAFDIMIRWKVEQFENTGRYNVLGVDWTMALLDRLWDAADQALRLEMHTLSINGELAAVDCGLTDGKTFHSWMVAYNPDFHKYSPGAQLLELLIDQASSLGYDIIDLGAGLQGYKRHYTGVNVSVRAGFIAARGPAAALAKLYGKAERLGEARSKNAVLSGAAGLPGRLRRRYQQVAACDTSFAGRTKAMLSAIKSGGK